MTRETYARGQDVEMKRLGERVRSLRVAAGVTQEQLALALGLHRSTINRFENGSQDVGASRLVAIGSALGVKASEFFDE